MIKRDVVVAFLHGRPRPHPGEAETKPTDNKADGEPMIAVLRAEGVRIEIDLAADEFSQLKEGSTLSLTIKPAGDA